MTLPTQVGNELQSVQQMPLYIYIYQAKGVVVVVVVLSDADDVSCSICSMLPVGDC